MGNVSLRRESGLVSPQGPVARPWQVRALLRNIEVQNAAGTNPVAAFIWSVTGMVTNSIYCVCFVKVKATWKKRNSVTVRLAKIFGGKSAKPHGGNWVKTWLHTNFELPRSISYHDTRAPKLAIFGLFRLKWPTSELWCRGKKCF